MNRGIIAILYDFDKTLSTTDMQNYEFIPNLDMTPSEFWGKTTEFSNKYHVERILSYMYMMVECCRVKGIPLTRDYLRSCGRKIKFFPGVSTWFKRINQYGEEHGFKIEHYLVSSGTKEIVEGCSIYDEFTQAYACEFYYDEKSGLPIWPKLAINYTQKTQYFFRIAKGVTDIRDDNSVNAKTKGLRIPYRNIIYLGDGMTDIACMTLVKSNGGRAIAVYPDKASEEEIDRVKNIYTDGRCNFVCKADYSANSDIEKVIRLIIDSIYTQEEIIKKQNSLMNKK